MGKKMFSLCGQTEHCIDSQHHRKAYFFDALGWSGSCWPSRHVASICGSAREESKPAHPCTSTGMLILQSGLSQGLQGVSVQDTLVSVQRSAFPQQIVWARAGHLCCPGCHVAKQAPHLCAVSTLASLGQEL